MRCEIRRCLDQFFLICNPLVRHISMRVLCFIYFINNIGLAIHWMWSIPLKIKPQYILRLFVNNILRVTCFGTFLPCVFSKIDMKHDFITLCLWSFRFSTIWLTELQIRILCWTSKGRQS